MIIKIILILLLMITPVMGQKIHYYRYGYEGIEKYGEWNDSTLIYSNHMAKPIIRKIVCDTILLRYINNKPLPNKIVIDVKKAIINGTLKITKKEKVIHLEFFYEKIIWKDSIIEKPIKKFVSKNKK